MTTMTITVVARQAKSKKVSPGKRRKAIRKQLGYLGRNLKTIDALLQISSLLLLDKRLYKLLLAINEVYRQQKWLQSIFFYLFLLVHKAQCRQKRVNLPLLAAMNA